MLNFKFCKELRCLWRQNKNKTENSFYVWNVAETASLGFFINSETETANVFAENKMTLRRHKLQKKTISINLRASVPDLLGQITNSSCRKPLFQYFFFRAILKETWTPVYITCMLCLKQKRFHNSLKQRSPPQILHHALATKVRVILLTRNIDLSRRLYSHVHPDCIMLIILTTKRTGKKRSRPSLLRFTTPCINH